MSDADTKERANQSPERGHRVSAEELRTLLARAENLDRDTPAYRLYSLLSEADDLISYSTVTGKQDRQWGMLRSKAHDFAKRLQPILSGKVLRYYPAIVAIHLNTRDPLFLPVWDNLEERGSRRAPSFSGCHISVKEWVKEKLRLRTPHNCFAG